MQQHHGTPIHGSKQQGTPIFGSHQQGPSKSQAKQIETPFCQSKPKKRKSSNFQQHQGENQTTHNEADNNQKNQLIRLEQSKDQSLEPSGELMEPMQVVTDSERKKSRKELEDKQHKKCCVHCKDDPNLGLVVMQEQHEQLADEVKEGFTTFRKEDKLIHIKLDTYKASVGMLKERCDEQHTNSKNLLADVKELQNEVEEQYDDCVNLVSGWFREERETRREEIDETRKDISGHDKQIIRMQNDVAEYNQRVTEAENEVIESRERLIQVAEDCAGHAQQLVEHSQRLIEHHDRHTAHDDRHNLHDVQLKGHATQLVGHGERLAEHHEQFLGLNNRLSAYDDQSDGHARNLSELNAWKLEIEDKIAKTEERDNQRKALYDNLKEQHNEQQKILKCVSDKVDELHDKLAEACDTRDKALEKNRAYVDLIAKERTEISRLEQKVENVMEEQKKMREDYQKYQARIGATMVEKSRADIVVFKAQATKIEALESQIGSLTPLVEQLQTQLAQVKHLPTWTQTLEHNILLCQRQVDHDLRLGQRQPVQARNLEARVRKLEEQTVQQTGLKDWQARMELYFNGSRDTMFTWTKGELKEHQSSLNSQIESLKAQFDSRETESKMMNKRLEDQDLKFLTLRTLLLGKTNLPSIQTAILSSEMALERRPEDDATWSSSPTMVMADADLIQDVEEDVAPQVLDEPDADSNGQDCTVQPAMDVEQSRLDHSSALYDPCREVPKESSPALDETAQTPSSPLSSIRSSILDNAEDNAESDQEFVMPDVSVHEEDSQADQDEDSTKVCDEDSNDPVHAHNSTRKDGWSKGEIEVVRDTMHGSEDRVLSMAERYRLCEQRLSEKGFKRSFNSCKQLWNNKLAPANRRRSHHWSEREIEIFRDTMSEFENRATPMPERYSLCEQRLREQGFARTYSACKRLWNEKLDSSERRRRLAWSKEEIELLQDTMKELQGEHRSMGELFAICENKFAEKGFKRSREACHLRYYRGGAGEEHMWTEHQIHLLGKAFQATIGAYGRDHQRFKRISEMLNNTGEMPVYVTAQACMKQWKIQDGILKSHGARPSVLPKERSSMTPVAEDSNLTEELSADHTEQASYLLEHLTSDYESGPSQELQKQNPSHIDQSALCNAEREADEAPVAPVFACQGTATSTSSPDTSSKIPIIEITEITPPRQVAEQLPDNDQTSEVVAEQVMNENPSRPTAIDATTESVAEHQDVDVRNESILGTQVSDHALQDLSRVPAATVGAELANFRCYEGFQMDLRSDLPAQGYTSDRMTHNESSMPVHRSIGDEQEPSAADLAAAVAEEIAEHCEETTNCWGPMDIGFWIADSN